MGGRRRNSANTVQGRLDGIDFASEDMLGVGGAKAARRAEAERAGRKKSVRVLRDEYPNYPIVAVETDRHKSAFEYWLQLGKVRNASKVARQYGTSSRTIRSWMLSFDWEGRKLERIGEVEKEALKRYDACEMSTPEELQHELKAMRVKLREVFDSLFVVRGGKLELRIPIEDMQDVGVVFRMYQQLIKLDLDTKGLKQQSDQVKELHVVKKEIRNFFVGLSQDDRMELLRQMNGVGEGDEEEGEGEGYVEVGDDGGEDTATTVATEEGEWNELD